HTIVRMVCNEAFPPQSVSVFSHLHLRVTKMSEIASVRASLIKDAVQFTSSTLLFVPQNPEQNAHGDSAKKIWLPHFFERAASFSISLTKISCSRSGLNKV